ncbi:MAG: hypothetical protein LBU72_02190 [Burkholderiaceae bacterium]|jgi:hypothetical protein|nr:hypothetical protein [Burkholderiaceae bacterium]
MSTPTEPYDPTALNRLAPDFYARLERMCQIAERARQKLARVKNADQHIACLLQARSALIKKCLDLEITAESIASMILEDAGDLPISRRKLMGAINRCQLAPASDGACSKRGRPRKNQDAGPQQPGPDAAASATSTAETVIATAKNASAAPAPAAKQAAKPERPPAAPIPKDSPEREQKMRRRAPIW